MPRLPVLVLVVLDGWGLSNLEHGNAIAQAHIPTFKKLCSRYPWTCLEASGSRVGLPENQAGNSEVGHFNIGAGRAIHQNITRINQAISSGEFFHNKAIRRILQVSQGSRLHLLGLISDGGVHSHLKHLTALLRFAQKEGVKEVFIHGFTDGRDAPLKKGQDYLRNIMEQTRQIGLGHIASISGRYYAMDRDKRWLRTKRAYEAITGSPSAKSFYNPLEGLHQSYRHEITDEFVVPFVTVDQEGRPIGKLLPNDAAIFFNFRSDRARQLTRALTNNDFKHFSREQDPTSHFLSMTPYDRTFELPTAFPKIRLHKTLDKVFSKNKVKNLRLAETEKYAHVSYFFNGGDEQLLPEEKRVLIPSSQVPTYDLKPEMSAFEITDQLLHELNQGTYQTIVVNFANADMVGHTGVFEATVKAVETVDTCLARIYKKLREIGGIMMVTADHGNAEQMIDPKNGQVHTAHTNNLVPFILADDNCGKKLRKGGALEDIAPTLLQSLEIEKPTEMTGQSLLLAD